jgi:hypothetical protein
LADLAKRMRPVASAEEIQIILDAAGKARTPRDLNEATKAAECIIRGEARTATSAMAPTFEAFAKEWTSGELRKKHPDHVREKKDPSEDVQILRDRINPLIGMLHLPEITLEHAERVMRALPSSLAPRTRRHTAQCLRKVLSLAVYPGRHIASNPIPREWMPKIPKSANKAKACLWPEEDAKLARCAQIDLVTRHPHGATARQGHGAGWKHEQPKVLDATSGRVTSSPGGARQGADVVLTATGRRPDVGPRIASVPEPQAEASRCRQWA